MWCSVGLQSMKEPSQQYITDYSPVAGNSNVCYLFIDFLSLTQKGWLAFLNLNESYECKDIYILIFFFSPLVYLFHGYSTWNGAKLVLLIYVIHGDQLHAFDESASLIDQISSTLEEKSYCWDCKRLRCVVYPVYQMSISIAVFPAHPRFGSLLGSFITYKCIMFCSLIVLVLTVALLWPS